MLNRFRLTGLLIFALLVASCSVNPVTGKNEFSLVSAQQEVAIGGQQYQPSQQAQGGRYYIDPDIQLYVAGVGKKLAAVSDRPNLPYEFVVLNSSVPNAWALPGGKIAVNRGLLLHLEDEAQLAAVLAHEIVHAAARHGASRVTTGTLLNVGAAALGMAGQKYGMGQTGSQVAQLGAAAWMAKYGRDDELESDAYGMDYMVRAGYDPYAAVELQKTFVELNKRRSQDFLSGLFASHPPSQERVTKNLAKAATLPKGQTYRDRYQRAVAQLRRDKPAYTAETNAIKALKAKDAKTALNELDKAVNIQPGEGYFWELRGHAWEMQKNPDNAEKSFSTAIRKNPDFFSHYLSRGTLRYEQGNKTGAQADLKASHRLLPTPIASYYLGEIALEQGDKAGATKYFQEAAQSRSDLGQKARERLSTLELATAPHKYIASKAFIDSNGYLKIAVRNNSAVAVTGVQVSLAEMLNAFMVGSSSTLRVRGTLPPGEQTTISTGIGPLENSNAVRQYQVRVTAAKAAQ